MIYNKPNSIDQEEKREMTYSDAPPPYSAIVNDIPSSPSQHSSYSRTQQITAYYPPEASTSYQQSQTSAAKYKYESSRGLIGNSIGFVTHELSSRVASKNTNDATKAVIDTVCKFVDDRFNKKEMKSREKVERREYKHEAKQERRDAKHDRRAHRCCNHTEECHIQQLPQPHQQHQQPFFQQPFLNRQYAYTTGDSKY